VEEVAKFPHSTLVLLIGITTLEGKKIMILLTVEGHWLQAVKKGLGVL
jgi:hypothetical protein